MILLIQTGGTIDKDYPRATKGWGFEITDPAVERILERAKPSFHFEIVSLLKKDSQEITDEDRELIAKKCLSTDHEKIIITHGTDTMIDTAAYLANKVKDRTIVLTGAAKPEHFKDSDADFNVGMAVGSVQNLPSGVYIAMHGKVLPYDKTIRETSTGKFVEKE
ncbi:MAG TPA: asparaginase domain-containing protein [Candidatus Saccharimonadales bacterium]|jgi:L-asparaginase